MITHQRKLLRRTEERIEQAKRAEQTAKTIQGGGAGLKNPTGRIHDQKGWYQQIREKKAVGREWLQTGQGRTLRNTRLEIQALTEIKSHTSASGWRNSYLDYSCICLPLHVPPHPPLPSHQLMPYFLQVPPRQNACSSLSLLPCVLPASLNLHFTGFPVVPFPSTWLCLHSMDLWCTCLASWNHSSCQSHPPHCTLHLGRTYLLCFSLQSVLTHGSRMEGGVHVDQWEKELC